MVSEILEESGLDRQTARKLRREVLQGMILLCQWQLERIERSERRERENGPTRIRRVKVE
jgi:hypothetical protein